MIERFAIAWITRFGVEHQPKWFVQWLDNILIRYNERVFIPRVMAAQEIISAWAEPNTPNDEIIAWIDTQIGNARDDVPSALCLFGIWLIPATEADWAVNSVPDETLATWMGQKDRWYHSGRSEIKNQIPETHDGLYIVVNDGSIAVAKALNLGEATS